MTCNTCRNNKILCSTTWLSILAISLVAGGVILLAVSSNTGAGTKEALEIAAPITAGLGTVVGGIAICKAATPGQGILKNYILPGFFWAGSCTIAFILMYLSNDMKCAPVLLLVLGLVGTSISTLVLTINNAKNGDCQRTIKELSADYVRAMEIVCRHAEDTISNSEKNFAQWGWYGDDGEPKEQSEIEKAKAIILDFEKNHSIQAEKIRKSILKKNDELKAGKEYLDKCTAKRKAEAEAAEEAKKAAARRKAIEEEAREAAEVRKAAEAAGKIIKLQPDSDSSSSETDDVGQLGGTRTKKCRLRRRLAKLFAA